jgi:hypothetical protein
MLTLESYQHIQIIVKYTNNYRMVWLLKIVNKSKKYLHWNVTVKSNSIEYSINYIKLKYITNKMFLPLTI